MGNVLITGASSGLGLCLSQYYGKDSQVINLDIEAPKSSDNASHVAFDLASFNEKDLFELRDPFDIVICNAGISVSGNFKDIAFDEEEKVFKINALGHIQLIKYLLKNNLVKESGRIAFICSASEFFPFPIALSYSASKSALDGFARALESYLVGKKISVTRVYPGPMNTPHSKYYPGAATEGGRKPEQSVGAIVKGIDKRKQKVYPDPISRLYKILSRIVPGLLVKKAHSFYKERL